MADGIAILPEFPFAEQVHELAAFLARAVPAEQGALAGIAERAAAEEQSEEQRRGVVHELVKVVAGSNGGFDANERELEPSYLLLTSLVVSASGAQDDNMREDVTSLVETVARASKAAASSGGSKGLQKSEVGYRILNNIYNLLPASSSLRPPTLLRLLSTLNDDLLPTLALPIGQVESALLAWSLEDAARVQWLGQLAEVYEGAAARQSQGEGAGPSASVSATAVQLRERALEARVLGITLSAVRSVPLNSGVVARTLGAALAVPSRVDLSPILSVQGVRDALDGDARTLVQALDGEGQVAELKAALKWAEGKDAWLKEIGISSDELARKLRLLALTSLCARSTTKDVKYADIASALDVPVSEVEQWVIDAIASNLLQARLAQPTQSLRVQSVYSRAFGASEWKLLEQRLGEWKNTIDEVKAVVDESLALAAQQEDQGRGDRRERRQYQQPNGVAA